MLLPLTNVPRDYAWGSPVLIADLQGRAPSGRPEAEVWFGDHSGSPALIDDGSGRTLAEGRGGERLPYLLKLLAAASPLSIQVHPSKEQAERGFARDEAAGLASDAADRNYRDDNHKPELIVALSERFEALAGLRDLATTRRVLDVLGDAAAPLRRRLDGSDEAAALRDAIAWVLSPDAAADVAAMIAAARTATPDGFADELALVRRLDEAYPGDPGIIVALLMNQVVLHRGETLSTEAGVLHAYLSGLGVELMAASDNVLRGGLTSKHIDVEELVGILDARPAPPTILTPEAVGDGISRFDAGVPDFALLRVEAEAGERSVATSGPAIVLATAGAISVRGAATDGGVRLTPGTAVFASADESPLTVSGSGEAYIAEPGR